MKLKGKEIIEEYCNTENVTEEEKQKLDENKDIIEKVVNFMLKGLKNEISKRPR